MRMTLRGCLLGKRFFSSLWKTVLLVWLSSFQSSLYAFLFISLPFLLFPPPATVLLPCRLAILKQFVAVSAPKFLLQLPMAERNRDEDMANLEDAQAPADEGEESDLIESDVELGGETVEPDNDPPQKMGDLSVEVTEERRDASQTAKGQAMEAISEGKLEEAIEHLTEAIFLVY